MTASQDRTAIERLEAEVARMRAAYLDLMRDSLIGRLNEDPPLPASKVEGYKDDYREQGWDWPSKAPSMIGARRMDNVRSECERVLQAGIPGDFMETGVWRGGACIMMRAVLKAYQVADRRVIAADSFAGFPVPSAAADAGFEFHGHAGFRGAAGGGEGGVRPLRPARCAGRFSGRAVQGHAAGGAGRSARAAAARWRHVREHAWTASSTSTTSCRPAAR